MNSSPHSELVDHLRAGACDQCNAAADLLVSLFEQLQTAERDIQDLTRRMDLEITARMEAVEQLRAYEKYGEERATAYKRLHEQLEAAQRRIEELEDERDELISDIGGTLSQPSYPANSPKWYPGYEGDYTEDEELVRASTQPEVETCTCLAYRDGLNQLTGKVKANKNCPVHGEQSPAISPLVTENHECEKCHTSAEQRIETVDERGPGFKCENCRWWNWLDASVPAKSPS